MVVCNCDTFKGTNVTAQTAGGGTAVIARTDRGCGATAIEAITATDAGSGIAAIKAQNHTPGELASDFIGNVRVQGHILLSNPDCAEEFEISTPEVEPGTVMMLNEFGSLQQSYLAYDKKVAGVISGAGDYKPAIILHNKERANGINRLPIALVGKTYCKVDASYGAIETGDLITTSHTPGHAMKATDPLKAFGSVIGKALSSLKPGERERILEQLDKNRI